MLSGTLNFQTILFIIYPYLEIIAGFNDIKTQLKLLFLVRIISESHAAVAAEILPRSHFHKTFNIIRQQQSASCKITLNIEQLHVISKSV